MVPGRFGAERPEEADELGQLVFLDLPEDRGSRDPEHARGPGTVTLGGLERLADLFLLAVLQREDRSPLGLLSEQGLSQPLVLGIFR